VNSGAMHKNKNNMNRNLIGTILIGALILGSYPVICHAKTYFEIGGKIQKGQSKRTIIDLLGEPLTKMITVKQNKFIWGPEEKFWDNIPMKTRLEVWKYEFSDGNLNLYFLNEGGHLDYKAFAPIGVVY
jgi:hypothetical protein